MRQLPLGVHLHAAATFAGFAPGMNSELLAALRQPGGEPLWLWGGRGSGKTHLLQAVCADGADRAYFPLSRTLALPPDAVKGFERCRVLCLDDVDAVAGDLAWEQTLFGLFNECADLRSRLILAAAGPPRRIEWCLDDWRSRAASCIVYQVREPDEAGRIEALELRAAQRGLELPHDAAEYLLRRMPRDLPSLLEILDRLDEASMIAQRRLTIPFIRDALERLAGTAP